MNEEGGQWLLLFHVRASLGLGKQKYAERPGTETDAASYFSDKQNEGPPTPARVERERRAITQAWAVHFIMSGTCDHLK